MALFFKFTPNLIRLHNFKPVMFSTKTFSKMFSIAKQTLFRNFKRIMDSLMFFVANNFKIFNSIVQFILIDVVYMFLGLKITAQKFLHNKAMFKNIPISFSGRTGGTINKFITLMKRATFIRPLTHYIAFKITASAKSTFIIIKISFRLINNLSVALTTYFDERHKYLGIKPQIERSLP